MKNSLVIILLLLFGLVVIAGCGKSANTKAEEEKDSGNKLKVVTTTSLIADIVEDVGGARVKVVNIIPPASCPGHFDVKPGDMKVLADADLFMLHNWQGEKFSGDMIKSAANKDLKKVVLAIKGNWMVPETRNIAIEKITNALAEADQENVESYKEKAGKLKDKTKRTAQKLKNTLQEAGVNNIKVMANNFQVPFLKWAGLNVIDTFGRSGDVTSKEMEQLINKGNENNVTLVVSNLQSGSDLGSNIAEEIKAAHITLTNFPGGLPGTETWSDSITKNVDLVWENIKQ